MGVVTSLHRESEKKTTVLLPPNDVRLGFIWLQTEPIGTQPTVY